MLELYNGDCLEVIDELIKKGIKVDAIIADIPFGTTRCSWDSIIPLKDMWTRLKLIRKDTTPIVLHGAEPFSSYLRLSNITEYKYDWIWEKNKSTGFLNSKKQPLRTYEHIHVFYKKQCTYNPQKTTGHKPVNSFTKHRSDGDTLGNTKTGFTGGGQTDRYPKNIIKIPVVNNDGSGEEKLHPTQKPLALSEYLIKTYTNEGDLILDFTMGSGDYVDQQLTWIDLL